MKNCQFNAAVMVRSPYYSFIDYNINRLPQLLADPLFQRAIYLASPELFSLLEDKEFNADALNDKQRLTILKYINRMYYRPTPFGGFSSFSAATWRAPANVLVLDDLKAASLRLNWDQEIVLKLAEPIFSQNLKNTQLQINPTLYHVLNEYRFITTDIDFTLKKLRFNLEAIDKDELLDIIIDALRQKATLSVLVECIINFTGWSAADAEDYIHALFELQVIKADNYPHTSGYDYLTGLSQRYPDLLPGGLINQLSLNNLENKLDDICKMAQQMNHYLVANNLTRPKHFFYANTSRPVRAGGVPIHYQQKINDTLNALYRVLPVPQSAKLRKFTEEFTKRYDLREVPLLQVLDPETGIDYAGLAARYTKDPLLDSLSFKSLEPAVKLEWTALHRLLLKRWVSPRVASEGIVLSTDDLQADGNDQLPLAPSFAVFFRGLGKQLLLESAGGVTAIAIIGRFTCLSNEFFDIAKSMISLEQAANPTVVFADIAQLGDIHVDNINRRASLYEHEIVINGGSDLPEEQQLPLSDLWLSCRNGQLVLRSHRLNKRIIPRLASAYNYNHHDLAAFRFLCDLQYQGVQSNLAFDLEQFFPGLKEYPRVTLGDVIISVAKWYLNEADLKLPEQIDQLIHERGLPRYVALAQADQQLVFDLHSQDEKLFLLNCIRGAKNIQLQEYLLPDDFPVQDAEGKPMISQFVSFIHNNEEVYKPLVFEKAEMADVDRVYTPGSPWVYFKIYCHEQAANRLLAGPLHQFLMRAGEGWFDTWFFIRYHDPLPHIRLRVKVKDEDTGKVIRTLRQLLEQDGSIELVKDYQLHVYQRELERYHPLLIDQVEEVFNRSSALVCSFIKNEEFAGINQQAYKLAFISLNDMLNVFLDSAGQKIEFTEQVWQSLFTEFNGDKQLKVSLDQKYRNIKTGLECLPDDLDFYSRLKLKAVHTRFIDSLYKLKVKMEGIDDEKRLRILADIIHMHFNRVFANEQRKQELTIYYMMHKYLLARKAIMKFVVL
ncbi:MAG: lantibiotic dehydratase [Mucilaginibacter sp.]|uniref:lantibiotic dehydratase n=1 Tax=Mucilaginibacter sp. TaxID=1882438 RepID=UPI0031A705BE